MGDEEDIPGEELSSVIRGANGAPVADALIGCRFYRDDPDDLATITQCDRGSGRLSLQSPVGATRVAGLAGHLEKLWLLKGRFDSLCQRSGGGIDGRTAWVL